MDLNTRTRLEEQGYQVITTQQLDPHFRTRTFIRKPDGTFSAFYDELWQIPQSLNQGDEVSTYVTEVPAPAQNTSSYCGHAAQYQYQLDGTLGPFLFCLALIFVGIFVGILFMRAFFHNQWNPPPCGETGSITEIDECVKMIVYPDCSGVMYDSCEKEIIDSFAPPEGPPHWTTGAMWIAIGVVAIAAIIIIPTLLKPRHHPPPYYPPPPPPPQDTYSYTYG